MKLKTLKDIELTEEDFREGRGKYGLDILTEDLAVILLKDKEKQEIIKDIKCYRKGTIGMPITIQDYIKWKFNITEEDLKNA